jgi:hypothetical protein
VKSEALAAARAFVEAEGRPLERRVLAAVFDGADPAAVVDALRSYRNPDGGFGWGLEPDKRVPASQPLDCQLAFEAMDAVGYVDQNIVRAACDWLVTLGPAVGCITPAALDHPRAPHWDAVEPPSLNPSAALAGLLWKWGIDHPWRSAATDWCWDQLRDGIPASAHSVQCVLTFLEHVPDRAVSARLVGALGPKLPTLEWFNYEPEATYGLTPLHLVPSPGRRWAALFPGDLLERHLDALEAAQLPDGGWPISWTTIGPAAEQEWRGFVTTANLRILDAYDRIEASATRPG